MTNILASRPDSPDPRPLATSIHARPDANGSGRLFASIAIASLIAALATPWAEAQVTAKTDAQAVAVQKKLKPDTTGKKRRGEASYYHRNFNGRKMADGTPFDPKSNNAASKTLPLGTKAKVTNLENGKSAVVEIRDRGPYAEGRIVDLSPSTARKLDMQDDGVAPVEVAPISVPLPDGSVKPGAAAVDSNPSRSEVVGSR